MGLHTPSNQHLSEVAENKLQTQASQGPVMSTPQLLDGPVEILPVTKRTEMETFSQHPVRMRTEMGNIHTLLE